MTADAVRKDGTPVTQRMPARHYSWPPFEKGNTAAVVHGAFSKRMVSERAREIHAELAEVCPWTLECDAASVELFCTEQARYKMLDEHVERVAEERGIGAVKPYLLSERRLQGLNVLKAIEALGLSPSARGRLLRDLGAARMSGIDGDLRTLGAQGRKLRALRGRDA